MMFGNYQNSVSRKVTLVTLSFLIALPVKAGIRERIESTRHNSAAHEIQGAYRNHKKTQMEDKRRQIEESYLKTYKATYLGLGSTAESELVRSTYMPKARGKQTMDKLISNPNIAKGLRRTGSDIPKDLIYGILSYSETNPLKAMEGLNKGCRKHVYGFSPKFAKTVFSKAWSINFGNTFVPIPEGFLSRNQNGQQVLTPMAPFEAKSFVTRKDWLDVMGAMPEHVPPRERTTWNNCSDCPVTYVNWENKDYTPAEVQTFLARLNKRERVSGCTYDLPTDPQLEYMHRGDSTGLRPTEIQNDTGENVSVFFWAKDPQNPNGDLIPVTDANVNDYVTYWGNSNHPNGPKNQIQPMGHKLPNSYGIESGNAWKMSKDLNDPAHPERGRSVRGGSWPCFALCAQSGIRGAAYAGYRNDFMGFALSRTCH